MQRLLLLGLFALITTSMGDVKHVLDGSAHPPPCYQDHQHYHHSAGGNFASQSSSNAVVPGSVAFWWADSDSPFKQAYEYFKKCSSKSDCLPPVAPSFQVPASPVSNDNTLSKSNLDRNPFLNGQIKDVNYGPTKLDLSKNPFLNTGMQAAYSSTGQAVTTGSEGFLGVQPAVPFSPAAQPFAVSYPGPDNLQKPSFASQHPSAAGQPFSNSYPSCAGGDKVCVSPHLCHNGIVGQNVQQSDIARKLLDGRCTVGKEECCLFLTGTSSSSFESSSSFSSSFSNLSHFASGGQASSSDSIIKFNGGVGISPGSIQIISDDEPIPNPLIKSGVKGGTNPINKIKVRNTYNNGASKSVFASTVDYTNEKFDDLTFDSAFQGPQYLPPFEGTKPPVPLTPELHPPFSYQPSTPTTSRPIFPIQSSTSYHPSTARPFTPSIYQPSTSRPQFTVQSSTNYQPSTARPQTPSIYQPSTSRPQFTIQSSSNYHPSTARPQTPSIYQPSTSRPQFTIQSSSYYQPSTTRPQTPSIYQPQFTVQSSSTARPEFTSNYHPSTPRPQFTVQSSSTARPQYSPPSFPSQPTQRPTASNEYLPPYPSTPKPSYTVHVPTDTKVSTQYVNPSVTNTPPHNIYTRPSTVTSKPTPGYQYPEPSPTFNYPKPSTSKPGGGFNINNQYNTRPTTHKQPPTAGYTYPSPTPSFGYPSPQPKPTPKPSPFRPPINAITTQFVKPGYSYPTPHPPFTYSPESSNVGEVYRPKPTINQYLPPHVTTEPNLETGASGTGSVIRPPPNNQKPSPNEPVGSVVSPHGGCAAALKCVQEIYCTAEGMISPTPVVLTKEQEFSRVPTTECFDRQAGVAGKCCRDPFYVDPWPSANLVNGVDDGQYREDPRLGQYFAQKARPVRSGATKDVAKVEKCGIRNPNISPRGESPLDVNFAEIPWQAMVLRDTNRSLLCGGVIIKPNVVLTAAHCVEGLYTRDILVKGGEWKLGIDEEPLPFQIVKVAAVIRHPEYTPGSLKNDLAILMLDEKLRMAKNIAPICLPSGNQQPSGQCITTGWGKRILQLHLRGAIMRSIDVNQIDSSTCTQKLQSKYQGVLPDFSESVICTTSQNDQCDVDYGSALACTNGNGQYTLAGIFSWETGCKDSNQIGGYIPPDMSWIETTCSKPLKELKALDKQYRQ